MLDVLCIMPYMYKCSKNILCNIKYIIENTYDKNVIKIEIILGRQIYSSFI